MGPRGMWERQVMVLCRFGCVEWLDFGLAGGESRVSYVGVIENARVIVLLCIASRPCVVAEYLASMLGSFSGYTFGPCSRI